MQKDSGMQAWKEKKKKNYFLTVQGNNTNKPCQLQKNDITSITLNLTKKQKDSIFYYKWIISMFSASQFPPNLFMIGDE